MIYFIKETVSTVAAAVELQQYSKEMENLPPEMQQNAAYQKKFLEKGLNTLWKASLHRIKYVFTFNFIVGYDGSWKDS
jgi:hypothetical protein